MGPRGVAHFRTRGPLCVELNISCVRVCVLRNCVNEQTVLEHEQAPAGRANWPWRRPCQRLSAFLCLCWRQTGTGHTTKPITQTRRLRSWHHFDGSPRRRPSRLDWTGLVWPGLEGAGWRRLARAAAPARRTHLSWIARFGEAAAAAKEVESGPDWPDCRC